jgi:DNA/RNA-binding domain of Phe-tRNA-synthetase-like protein
MSDPPAGLPVTLDPDVRHLTRAAVVTAAPVSIGPATEALDREMADQAASLAARHAGRTPSEIPGLAPARELYKAFGVDPTRTRPSSEALLRRALQGKPMPRILNAVDVCNLCSLRYLLPLGLYDAGKVRGPATLRRGRPGESYAGIRKDEVHVAGRIVLADVEGPFGNPTSDSLRTSVDETTAALALVIFAPSSYPADALATHAEDAASTLARHLAPPGAAVTTAVTLLP